MWQWKKHEPTTTQLKQTDRQLSEQQLVEPVQSDQKLSSRLATFCHPYFRALTVFSLWTILRKAKPLTAIITWHYWIDWSQKSRKNDFSWKIKSAVPPRQWIVPQSHENDGQIERIKPEIASSPIIFCRTGPQWLLSLYWLKQNAPGKERYH